MVKFQDSLEASQKISEYTDRIESLRKKVDKLRGIEPELFICYQPYLQIQPVLVTNHVIWSLCRDRQEQNRAVKPTGDSASATAYEKAAHFQVQRTQHQSVWPEQE